MRGNALDLAVGVVIGAAFSTIVKAIVDFIVMPLVSLITFSSDFEDWALNIGNVSIKYGELISAIVNFICIAFVIFLFVKFINKILPKKEEKKEEDETVKLLKEIRDKL
jgi:large conductance mechanosensitive channel